MFCTKEKRKEARGQSPFTFLLVNYDVLVLKEAYKVLISIQFNHPFVRFNLLRPLNLNLFPSPSSLTWISNIPIILDAENTCLHLGLCSGQVWSISWSSSRSALTLAPLLLRFTLSQCSDVQQVSVPGAALSALPPDSEPSVNFTESLEIQWPGNNPLCPWPQCQKRG